MARADDHRLPSNACHAPRQRSRTRTDARSRPTSQKVGTAAEYSNTPDSRSVHAGPSVLDEAQNSNSRGVRDEAAEWLGGGSLPDPRFRRRELCLECWIVNPDVLSGNQTVAEFEYMHKAKLNQGTRPVQAKGPAPCVSPPQNIVNGK